MNPDPELPALAPPAAPQRPLAEAR
ncbi:MAG: hypothetical protein RL375_4320, partial [Pseudomonadota bacterium]